MIGGVVMTRNGSEVHGGRLVIDLNTGRATGTVDNGDWTEIVISNPAATFQVGAGPFGPIP